MEEVANNFGGRDFKKNKRISGGSRISPRWGRQHMILPKSTKNCMKLKEFGSPGGGGTRPKFYYVDPPLGMM